MSQHATEHAVGMDGAKLARAGGKVIKMTGGIGLHGRMDRSSIRRPLGWFVGLLVCAGFDHVHAIVLGAGANGAGGRRDPDGLRLTGGREHGRLGIDANTRAQAAKSQVIGSWHLTLRCLRVVISPASPADPTCACARMRIRPQTPASPGCAWRRAWRRHLRVSGRCARGAATVRSRSSSARARPASRPARSSASQVRFG